MRLKEVRVRNFRNILDSSAVPIEDDITCVVGKNESGKTAFLKALYMLEPAYRNEKFSAQRHYPAWLEKRHRKEGVDIDSVKPVEARFVLEEADVKSIAERFGEGALTSTEITVSREYSGRAVLTFESDEKRAVEHLVKGIKLPKSVTGEIKSFEDVGIAVDKLREGDRADPELAELLRKRCSEILGGREKLRQAMCDALDEFVPLFFYFDEYSGLQGSVKIRDILERKLEDLEDSDRTARALLEMAGADKEYLLDPDYETRKRELENVANSITAEVLEYWSTNTELRVQIDITQKNIDIQNGRKTVLDELKIRLWDDRHLLSLPFDERSTGFRWFFSFLAAFSEFEYGDRRVVILLDEPGLGLHARAQKDFLRFIEERLSKKCQVLYSTHSPFMIQPNKLHRARLVEDGGRELGSRVTADVLGTDKDTLFPLQSALGYDLAQHLFVAPNNLVVEGTSDYTYLFLLSDFLRAAGREGLNSKWSIVPVGGADLVPSFVALLGVHLEVTVLLDSRKEGHQRLARLADQNILTRGRIITIGEVLGRKLADIEDLFEVSEYLALYTAAFGPGLKESDLTGNDPVVNRIARILGADRFDHGKPADVLLKTRDVFLPTLSAATLDRFEEVFRRINATLGQR